MVPKYFENRYGKDKGGTNKIGFIRINSGSNELNDQCGKTNNNKTIDIDYTAVTFKVEKFFK